MARAGRGSVWMVLVCVASCCAGARSPAGAALGQAPVAGQALGAVAGRVLYADTNLPARLASVVLVPAVEAVPKVPRDGEKPAARSRRAWCRRCSMAHSR